MPSELKQEANTEIWATDCPLAALQFQQHAGVKPMHPVSVLARAYERDGFGTARLEAENPDSSEKGE